MIIRAIFGHKSYIFLLASLNVKSVETKFHWWGQYLEVEVTCHVFRFYFLGSSVFVLFFA